MEKSPWINITTFDFLKYNPNEMSDRTFNDLKNSIEAFSDTIPDRKGKNHRLPIKVVINDFNNVILDGNHRLKALLEMGQDIIHKDDITHVLIEDPQKERAFVLAIRRIQGDFDDGKLKDILMEMDEEYMNLSGFNEGELANLLKEIGKESEINPEDEWIGMPEYEQEKVDEFQTIIIHFKTKKARDEFAIIINQKITDKTKYIHIPPEEKMDLTKRVIVDE